VTGDSDLGIDLLDNMNYVIDIYDESYNQIKFYIREKPDGQLIFNQNNDVRLIGKLVGDVVGTGYLRLTKSKAIQDYKYQNYFVYQEFLAHLELSFQDQVMTVANDNSFYQKKYSKIGFAARKH